MKPNIEYRVRQSWNSGALEIEIIVDGITKATKLYVPLDWLVVKREV